MRKRQSTRYADRAKLKMDQAEVNRISVLLIFERRGANIDKEDVSEVNSFESLKIHIGHS